MKISFNDVVSFSAGMNLSRLGDDSIGKESIYGVGDFENDMSCSYPYINEPDINYSKGVLVAPNDCIVHMNKCKAVIPSGASVGKILSANYIKGRINSGMIYPWYLCYS